MNYSKPKMLMSLLVVTALAVPISAVADGLADDSGTYFKGPMATCLSKAKVVYPCVSLSPPAYQFNSTFVTTLPMVDNLPLDTDHHESGWLAKLSDGEFWSINNLFSNDLHGMDMNFSADQTGTGMNMNLGPMKFNMYVDEQHFSESRFILGIDRSW
jgi:hypothetical protein